MFAILEYRLVGNTCVSIYNAKETIDEYILETDLESPEDGSLVTSIKCQ